MADRKKRFQTVGYLGLAGSVFLIAVSIVTGDWLTAGLASVGFGSLLYLSLTTTRVLDSEKALWDLMRWVGERGQFTTLDVFIDKGWSQQQIEATVMTAVKRQWIEIDTEAPGTMPVYKVVQ